MCMFNTIHKQLSCWFFYTHYNPSQLPNFLQEIGHLDVQIGDAMRREAQAQTMKLVSTYKRNKLHTICITRQFCTSALQYGLASLSDMCMLGIFDIGQHDMPCMLGYLSSDTCIISACMSLHVLWMMAYDIKRFSLVQIPSLSQDRPGTEGCSFRRDCCPVSHLDIYAATTSRCFGHKWGLLTIHAIMWGGDVVRYFGSCNFHMINSFWLRNYKMPYQ